MATTLLLLPLLSSLLLAVALAENVGINYGMLGSNLPPPDQVVSLLHSRNIGRVRLFNPDPAALDALRGSNFEVVVGTRNEDLPRLAADPSFAEQWVETNIVQYASAVNFRYIVAGNEVVPGELGQYVLPAIKNLDGAVRSAGYIVGVTTAVSTSVLSVSYPPSQGAFSDAASPIMTPIISFLSSKNTPLLVNIYPYFAYASDPTSIQLNYALLSSVAVVVQDGPVGYTNLFDAILDSIYSAMEKIGGSSMSIVVSETGWPSAGGGVGATIENARAYINNVVAYVSTANGSPKRPGIPLEVYLFALFNENEKPAGTEQNFGLYHPDMTEVYHVNFSVI